MSLHSDVPQHIEEVLARDGLYVGTTSGVSMWPMLRDRRDTIVVRPPVGRLRRYDVALYRRGDAYVLHRVVDVLPDSYTICGDNCLNREYDVRDTQIIGVLVGFFRDDRLIDIEGRLYRTYARVWCTLYPARRTAMLARGFAGRAARAIGLHRRCRL